MHAANSAAQARLPHFCSHLSALPTKGPHKSRQQLSQWLLCIGRLVTKCMCATAVHDGPFKGLAGMHAGVCSITLNWAGSMLPAGVILNTRLQTACSIVAECMGQHQCCSIATLWYWQQHTISARGCAHLRLASLCCRDVRVPCHRGARVAMHHVAAFTRRSFVVIHGQALQGSG